MRDTSGNGPDDAVGDITLTSRALLADFDLWQAGKIIQAGGRGDWTAWSRALADALRSVLDGEA
jgi:hypothetical protein